MSVKRLLCICPGGLAAVRRILGAMPGWDTCVVSSANEAAQVLAGQRYLVGMLIDYVGERQLGDLDRFLRMHCNTQWVAILDRTALAAARCRELITDHLYDYHTSPVDLPRLIHTLGHAHGWAALRTEKVAPAEPDKVSRLTGSSEAVVSLRKQIRRIAPVDAPVLISGESGSGKELTAQAIHELSGRAAGPFVAINCGAIPGSLIHSELFGHERGAFTGAAREKRGLIEAANGGTIFLDEIGDLPKDLQANLLRFLQERTIYRVGGTHSIAVNARVVAATHVNLEDAVAAGQFREDLYYRLNVLPIRVPSLRERKADLPVLAGMLFETYKSEKAAQLKGFGSDAMRAIAEHHWPGNVRELINRVRRAMVLAEGRLITAVDLGLAAAPIALAGRPLGSCRDDAERTAICAILAANGRNIAKSARQLGVSRMTLYRLISKHDIQA